jgi:ComF family protein
VNNWSSIIQDWLYPPTCLLCGDPGAAHRDLCAPCATALPYNRHPCPRCGAALNETAPGDSLCGRCQKERPQYDATIAPLLYQDPVRYLIRALKFGGRHPCARLLGTLLAEPIATLSERPERIIPVPLHPKRYRQRGFNQAMEIARPIARRLKIPLDPTACSRTRNTPPQARLTAKERKRNLSDAFTIKKGFAAEHIALVDDVITTGATVNELARALRKTGIKRIDVWACARA